MKITMIGTGYVGLVSGSCFADVGHVVHCVDIDEKKIHSLKNGILPIYEPFLEEVVKKNVSENRLFFTTSLVEALNHSTICFIAVPTLASETGQANLRHLHQVLEDLAHLLTDSKLIVIKSTVPVGTTENFKKTLNEKLQQRGCSFSCDVAFNPEFLKEGAALTDFMKPDRIIIGSQEEATIATLKELYRPFNQNHDRTLVMKTESAEMTKYAANVMLASRISLMNELALICEKVGADIRDVRIGIGSDSRIGYQFLYAGAGYGGSCFPKDIKALKALFHEHNLHPTLIDAIEMVNAHQKQRLAEKILNYFKESIAGKTLTILGLSFKPETDDIREAPSIELIQKLKHYPVKIHLFDPVAMPAMREKFPPSDQILYFTDAESALKDSNALILVTEWKQFRQLDFKKLSLIMREKVVFDGRNQYHGSLLNRLGFYYEGIGTT